MLRVAFIGCGRVGTTLALTLMSQGHRVMCGLSVRPHSVSAATFARLTELPVHYLNSEAAVHEARSADVIFVTTPDKAVTEIAQTLLDRDMVHAGQIVVHTSGAKSSDVLAPVQSTGAKVLCLHPLQTIASATVGPAVLAGVYCTLEGHPQAVELGKEWVRSWNGTPVVIDASIRPQYHAAAVLASNAIVALAAVATDICGIDEGLNALLPLIKGAVHNLETMGLPGALTGPIERGDIQTVQAHLNALESNPTARSVYAALGRATADLALRKGTLSTAMRQSFISLFDESK